MRPLGLVALGHDQYRVKGFSPFTLRTLPRCPGLSGIAQHFEERGEFLLVVGKDLLGRREQ
jgi:hypothetical protein